jgi:hypothetical protein
VYFAPPQFGQSQGQQNAYGTSGQSNPDCCIQ